MTFTVTAACADTSEALREHTYPGSFDYITKADVHGAMQRLGWQVQQLDALLRANIPRDDSHRVRAMALLTEMEATIRPLSPGGAVSNHPEFAARLAQFTEDVRAARESIESEPADYFLAGAVVGTCMYCHR